MSDINEMNVGVRWYVVHTYSGYENKVMTNLVKIVENRGLGHLIFDVKVPVETVVEKKGDAEKEVESKIFPGYVLVKMIMTEELACCEKHHGCYGLCRSRFTTHSAA